MHRFGEIAQHLERIGAVAVKPIKRTQRLGRLPRQHVFDEIKDAATIGEPEHGADRRARHRALAHRDRLIERAISITASSSTVAPSLPAMRRK